MTYWRWDYHWSWYWGLLEAPAPEPELPAPPAPPVRRGVPTDRKALRRLDVVKGIMAQYRRGHLHRR
jgi:hypothetical protein